MPKIEAKEDSKRISKLTKVSLGVNLTFRNQKSRCFTPFLSTSNVQLYFEKGVNPLGGLLSVLMAAGRVERSAAGSYRVLEPWCAGNEVKFRSAEARNDVPGDLLLKCPALVDAETEEQVRTYLSVYGAAIDLSTSGTTEDTPVSEEEGGEANPLQKLIEEQE
jgi:hypothetical protein